MCSFKEIKKIFERAWSDPIILEPLGVSCSTSQWQAVLVHNLRVMA
jgi:hypothetical protein